MTVYSYKARNQQGELVSGTLDMEDEGSVAANLDKLGYSVLEIGSTTAAGSVGDWLDRFRGLKKQEVILFTRQLATLIRSGMPLLPSLSTICEQTQNKKFKIILEDVRQSVQGGESLSDAMAKYPAVFSELFVSMIKVGEAGGIMDQVLDRLATLSNQEMEIQSALEFRPFVKTGDVFK